MLWTKKHVWRYVHDSGRKWRCGNCGLDRTSLPLIGTWRPWPPMCTG